MKYDPQNCPCKRIKSVRYKDCRACIQHHHTSGKLLTYCEKVERKIERKIKKAERKELKRKQKVTKSME